MRFETGLYSKLVEVVGNEKVFPDTVPGDFSEWPALVYAQNNSDDLYALSGPAPTDHRDTFDLTIWGPNRTDLNAVRDTLMAAFAGANARGMWGGEIAVEGAYCRDAVSQTTAATDGSERHDRSVSLSLVVCWQGERA